jgi:pyruvate-formate lyase-activating enzyme
MCLGFGEMGKFYADIDFFISENDKKRPLIFYGAGKFAQKNEARIFDTIGAKPVLYADKSDAKHGTQFIGVKVCSLAEAIAKYPDYLLVLTVSVEWLETIVDDILASGIPAERIKYPYKLDYRKCCYDFGSNMYMHLRDLYLCVVDKVKITPIHDKTPAQLTEIYNDFTKKQLDLFRSGQENVCTHCSYASNGYWLAEPYVRWVVIASGFIGDKCNYKCKDCTHVGFYNNPKMNDMKLAPFVRGFLPVAKQSGFEEMQFANGEPMLGPDFEDVISILGDNNVNFELFTNASIYKDSLAALAKRGLIHLCVDFSAGTPETYAKIKGVKAFEKAVNNLKTYKEFGARIELKYTIFENINDNLTEFEQFADITGRCADSVALSQDFYYDKKLSEDRKELISGFIEILKSKQIRYSFFDENLYDAKELGK